MFNSSQSKQFGIIAPQVAKGVINEHVEYSRTKAEEFIAPFRTTLSIASELINDRAKADQFTQDSIRRIDHEIDILRETPEHEIGLVQSYNPLYQTKPTKEALLKRKFKEKAEVPNFYHPDPSSFLQQSYVKTKLFFLNLVNNFSNKIDKPNEFIRLVNERFDDESLRNIHQTAEERRIIISRELEELNIKSKELSPSKLMLFTVLAAARIPAYIGFGTIAELAAMPSLLSALSTAPDNSPIKPILQTLVGITTASYVLPFFSIAGITRYLTYAIVDSTVSDIIQKRDNIPQAVIKRLFSSQLFFAIEGMVGMVGYFELSRLLDIKLSNETINYLLMIDKYKQLNL